MRTLLIIMASLILALTASAQAPDTVWTRVIGSDTMNEHCSAIRCTADGGFVAVGMASNYEIFKWMLAKLSNGGELEWMRYYEMYSPEETAVFAYATADGGYHLIRSEDEDFCLTKLNGSGDSLWSHYFGTERTERFVVGQEATDGGCLLLGETVDGDDINAYAVRVDADGDTLWTRSYGAAAWDFALSAEQAADGGWFIPIWYDAHQQWDGSLLRIDDNGDVLWSRTYPTWMLYSACALPGGCALGGTHDADPAIMYVDNEGSTEWFQDYGGWYMYGPPTVLADAGDGRIVASYCYSYVEMPRLGLLCTVIAEDTLWTQWYGPDLHSATVLSACATDGGFILTSVVRTGVDAYDLYLARLTPLGTSADPPGVPVPEEISFNAYPNPFNSVATIISYLPKRAAVSLEVSDLLGRHIAMLQDGVLEPGEYRFTFDASALPSGIYFARVKAGEFVQTQKLLLLK